MGKTFPHIKKNSEGIRCKVLSEKFFFCKNRKMPFCTISKFKFFWETSPIFYELTMILSLQKNFNFQTVFLFTFKDDCNKKSELFPESILTPFKSTFLQLFLGYSRTNVKDFNAFETRIKPKW